MKLVFSMKVLVLIMRTALINSHSAYADFNLEKSGKTSLKSAFLLKVPIPETSKTS